MGIFRRSERKLSRKNVLLVTHGGTSQAINSYFDGICEDGRVPRTGMQNCGIREYKL